MSQSQPGILSMPTAARKTRRRGPLNTTPPPRGIVRSAYIGDQPAQTLECLYANLPEIGREEFIGAHRLGNEGARLHVDRSDGHGCYEFFKLERDLYVMTMDCLYDTQREETVVGEGLLEMHLCLQGRLTLSLPGQGRPLIVNGPTLLLLHQPVGCGLRERLDPGTRHVGVSIYCRPEFLDNLLKRNGIRGCPLLDQLYAQPAQKVRHIVLPLSSTLYYIANSLLKAPLQGGFRLLHAEAKALEILCHAVSGSVGEPVQEPAVPSTVLRRLDAVRQILATQFSPIPHIRELALRVGMSESALKRAFKDCFGITLFDYGFECRMNHALTLLREKTASIGKIAEETGYQHQTSFTAAFREHYGFLPRDARQGVSSAWGDALT